MRVYCPNCGSDNEGMPGARVTCHACTASFEVPREPQTQAPAPAPLPPLASPLAPPPLGSAPSQFPLGHTGPPPVGFGVGSMRGSAQTNPLAIVSVILGILCCIPFSGIGAVVTGVLAQNQINASQGSQKGKELAVLGIVLGGLSFALAFIGFMLQLLGQGLR